MNIKKTFIFSLFSLLIFSASVFAQNDFKMTQRQVMTGRTTETTVMIKGARERTENNSSGMRQATIMQCDLKRTVHVNDIEKKYFIEPMMTDAPSETPAVAKTVSKGKTTKGGVVTQTIEITDTGERKQMFGLTARRIKTLMIVEPSPGACQKEASRVETDGWYVDLSPGMSCKIDRPPSDHESSSGGCVDTPKLIKKGTGKLGYALQVTTKFSVPGMEEQDAETKAMMARMGMGDGMMGMTTEITALSKAPQPAELFDIPVGYKQVDSMSDLFGRSTQKSIGEYNQTPQGKADRDKMMQEMGGGMPGMPGMSAGAKKAGVVRVGVMAVNNSSGKQLQTDNFQMMLTGQIRGDKIEAVKVSSMEEAKQLQCDYILNTDVQPFKQSTASKVGGLFGKVTGQGSQPKVDATVSYNLTPTSGAGLAVQNTATAKIEGEDNAAMMAIGEVAKAVMKALKNNQ